LTVKYPEKERGFIYDAAMAYAAEGVPLVIFAGGMAPFVPRWAQRVRGC
jgi:aconitase A